MKKKNTFLRIRRIVKKIPKGKVATYGQIAKLAGEKDARLVGWAIHKNTDPSDLQCHRVIRSDGTLASGYGMGGWQEQKALLVQEGIEFTKERTINLSKHLWSGR